MSQTKVQLVSNIVGNVSGGASFTGIVTASSFVGDGSGLTGVASTDNIVTGTAATFNNTVNLNAQTNSLNLNVTGVATIANLTVSGTETIINTTSLEVADKNVGIASTSTKLNDASLDGAGITIYGSDSDKTLIWDNANSRMAFNTDLYAPTYYGDGSQLTGISAGGLTTTSSSPSANTTVTLDLSAAQHHELTLTAGITTITCSGGSFGDSHSVVLIQPSSGIATVGFSTYFLFPSGSIPTMSEGSSKFDLISFVVKRVGAGGTQLLASAGLNYQ